MINLKLKGNGIHLSPYYLKHGNDQKDQIDDVKWDEGKSYEQNLADYVGRVEAEEGKF
jgi:hypothetical protein